MKLSEFESAYAEILQAARREDTDVVYSPKFREFGVRVDGVKAGHVGMVEQIAQLINTCPWTGKSLLPSLRTQWQKAVANSLGRVVPLEEHDADDIPVEFKSELWWIMRGL
jgi:hypothetical protein